MYHSNRNPLKKISRDPATSEVVDIVRGDRRRRLHKAFLRYHDANNWPMLREALKTMGRSDLIGNGKHHLIPSYQPITDGSYESARRKNSTPTPTGRGGAGHGGPAATARPVAKSLHHPSQVRPQARPNAQPQPGQILTQHTGLPPRDNGSRPPAKSARPLKPHGAAGKASTSASPSSRAGKPSPSGKPGKPAKPGQR